MRLPSVICIYCKLCPRGTVKGYFQEKCKQYLNDPPVMNRADPIKKHRHSFKAEMIGVLSQAPTLGHVSAYHLYRRHHGKPWFLKKNRSNPVA